MGVMFCWVCLKSSSVLKSQYFLANRYVCMNICMYVLHICMSYICMYVFYFKCYSVLMLKLSSKWQRGTWKLLKKRKFLWLWLKKRSLPEREVQQSFHMSAWRMHWWLPYVNTALSYSLYKYTDYGAQREGWSLSFFKMLWNVWSSGRVESSVFEWFVLSVVWMKRTVL